MFVRGIEGRFVSLRSNRGFRCQFYYEQAQRSISSNGCLRRDLIITRCYDGASTMSGCTGGVHALMRQEVCLMALYVHCWAHRLNLAVVAFCQDLDKVVSFFCNIQELYTFFSSTVRNEFFEKTQILGKYRGRHRERHCQLLAGVVNLRPALLWLLPLVRSSRQLNTSHRIEVAIVELQHNLLSV